MSDEKENVKKEFIYLELDRRRELRYGFKAIKLLEEEYDNITFLKLIDKLGESLTRGELSIDRLSFLIYVGLLRDDKDLTLERTIELLEESDYDLPTLADLISKIFQAFTGSSPGLTKDIRKKAQRVALAMKETSSLVERKGIPGIGASSAKQPSESSDGQKSISGTRRRENSMKPSKGKKKKRK